MRKKTQWLVAAAVCAVVMAAAVWATAPYCPSTGWQKMYLTNTGSNAYSDTGIGFYKIVASGSDSIVKYGLFLQNCTKTTLDTAIADTVAATKGTPCLMTGKVTDGSPSIYIHTAATSATDTGRITYSGTWSDSAGFKTYGSWSSTMTGGSGYAYDTYLWTGLAADLNFADTTSANLDAISLAGFLSYDSNTTYRTGDGTTDTIITVRGLETGPSNRVRLIIFKNGYLEADSALQRGSTSLGAADSGSWYYAGHFETGTYEFWAIGWDTALQLQSIVARRISIAASGAGSTNNTAGVTSVTATMPATNVTQRIQCSNWDNSVVSISVTPLSCGNAKADAYAQYDTNTTYFDTRVANSVFDITPMDANGNPLTYISGGMTIVGTVDTGAPGLTGITLSKLQSMCLMHLNKATGKWENLTTTWTGRTYTVSNVKSFSPFALGNISGSSTPSSDDSDCLITGALGNSPLARIMPSLRGVRDELMASAFGRLFVSGYYGLSAMMLLCAGLGLTVALKRR